MLIFSLVGIGIGSSFLIAASIINKKKKEVDPEVEAWRLAQARARCKM